jgi:neutral ceramidase
MRPEYNDPGLKKLLSGALALVLLLAALVAVGSLRWRPNRQAQPPRLEAVARGMGPLGAGVAEVPLELAGRVPVAGYPRLSWADEGARDPVSVRALVLSEPGCTVALVSVEILLVPSELTRAVQARLADLRLDALVLAATHTHSGPGGYWKNAVAERAATGPYEPRIFAALADGIAEAVRRAASGRVPAALSAASAEVPGLARNRDGGATDGRLLVVRLATARGQLAQVIAYPAHATLLGMENRRLSGDWPGELMRAQPTTTLFFQGAVGDQSAQLPHALAPTPQAYALALAAEVARLRLPPVDPAPALAAATVSTLLPAPELGASPPLLRRLAANLLHGWAPERSRVTALRLGPVLLLAVPAEPVAEVARQWRAAAGDGAEVVSLAGDYLGYVESAERMTEGTGETMRTYYGPELDQRLGRAVAAAAAASDGRSPAPKRSP